MSLKDIEANPVIETTGDDEEPVQTLHKTPLKAVNKSLYVNFINFMVSSNFE